LRRSQHSENTHPNVEEGIQPNWTIKIGEQPKHGAVRSEKNLAADEQVSEGIPAYQAEVAGDYETSKESASYVCVRESHRLETCEEQRITRYFADHDATDDQKVARSQKQAAP
jgi:hypothetical protein